MGMFAVPEYSFFPLDKFSDSSANGELQARRGEIQAAGGERAAIATIEAKWLNEARQNRGSADRNAVIASACRYLVLAQNTAAEEVKKTPDTPRGDRSAEFFHFAANELRSVDLLERAAQAYFNSAVQALRATRAVEKVAATVEATLALGIRSAGRARSMFDNLGEDEKADVAHALRLDLQRQRRRLQRDHLSHALLVLWGGLTRYGTDPARWLTTLSLALVGTTLIYAVMVYPEGQSPQSSWAAIKLHNGLGGSSAITPFYLSVVNLVSFGGYTNVTPQNWLGELALLLQSVVSFLWIGTGITFLTRR